MLQTSKNEETVKFTAVIQLGLRAGNTLVQNHLRRSLSIIVTLVELWFCTIIITSDGRIIKESVSGGSEVVSSTVWMVVHCRRTVCEKV